MGTAEFYDKYDALTMSGNKLVGEITKYAYCDENSLLHGIVEKFFMRTQKTEAGCTRPHSTMIMRTSN